MVKVTSNPERKAEHRNDSGNLWECLKQLGYGERMKTKITNITLDIGNNITSLLEKVADDNKHFSSVARKLVEKLPGLTIW